MGIDTILAFSDNNPQKWQGKIELNVNSKSYTKEIIPPNQITNYDFDTILVTSLMGYESIKKTALANGYCWGKIDISHSKGSLEARNSFAKILPYFARNLTYKAMSPSLAFFKGNLPKKSMNFSQIENAFYLTLLRALTKEICSMKIGQFKDWGLILMIPALIWWWIKCQIRTMSSSKKLVSPKCDRLRQWKIRLCQYRHRPLHEHFKRTWVFLP